MLGVNFSSVLYKFHIELEGCADVLKVVIESTKTLPQLIKAIISRMIRQFMVCDNRGGYGPSIENCHGTTDQESVTLQGDM